MGSCQSFFWYVTNYRFVICSLQRLLLLGYSQCHTKRRIGGPHPPNLLLVHSEKNNTDLEYINTLTSLQYYHSIIPFFFLNKKNILKFPKFHVCWNVKTLHDHCNLMSWLTCLNIPRQKFFLSVYDNDKDLRRCLAACNSVCEIITHGFTRHNLEDITMFQILIACIIHVHNCF